MTMRKLLRRRSAMRELLQNLETRPFCDELPQTAAGWALRPRPGLARAPAAVTVDLAKRPSRPGM